MLCISCSLNPVCAKKEKLLLDDFTGLIHIIENTPMECIPWARYFFYLKGGKKSPPTFNQCLVLIKRLRGARKQSPFHARIRGKDEKPARTGL
jgi:hypothetical protein